MMKWFRKHNKQLLAVFASALLVVWLGGTPLQRMFERNQFNEARLGHGTDTHRQREWQCPRQTPGHGDARYALVRPLGEPVGQTADQPARPRDPDGHDDHGQPVESR